MQSNARWLVRTCRRFDFRISALSIQVLDTQTQLPNCVGIVDGTLSKDVFDKATHSNTHTHTHIDMRTQYNSIPKSYSKYVIETDIVKRHLFFFSSSHS